MNKLNLKMILVLLTGLIITATSCQKNQDTPTSDTSFSSDDSFAELMYDDVSNMTDEAYDLGSEDLKSGGKHRYYLSPCATITLDSTADPRKIIIDFGEQNCLCNDGKYRRGKILVTFTGKYKKEESVKTVWFENYFVNDNQVDGQKVSTHEGMNEDGFIVFNTEVTGIIHLANDGGTLMWNASKTRTWIEGFKTKMVKDDIYLIDGKADGTKPAGYTWSKEIKESLRKEMTCRWIVKGIVEIKPLDKPIRILNYGDGDCDNEATVEIDGVIYTIMLK